MSFHIIIDTSDGWLIQELRVFFETLGQGSRGRLGRIQRFVAFLRAFGLDVSREFGLTEYMNTPVVRR